MRAVESAKQQDWPNIEIVIVDDASSDGSSDLVTVCAQNDDRIRCILRTSNGGPAVARNQIIQESQGEFIAFFDDDDESLQTRVSKQIAAIKEFENHHQTRLVACYAGGSRHYPNGYVKVLPAIGSKDIRPHGSAVADYLLFHRRIPDWLYGSGTPTCSLLARRETFLALGGFDENLRRVEDVDFAIRLSLKDGWFIGTKEPLFVQYATTGSDKNPEANRDAEIALATKHQGYLRSVHRYDYARRWPNLRYFHFKRRYDRFLIEFAKIAVKNPVEAFKHLWVSGPRRLGHEWKMKKRTPS